MKIKILEVNEVAGQLRIKVDTPYGVEDLGLSLEKKKADPITGQPLWLSEVRDLLTKKYNNVEAPTSGEELIGQELDI